MKTKKKGRKQWRGSLASRYSSVYNNLYSNTDRHCIPVTTLQCAKWFIYSCVSTLSLDITANHPKLVTPCCFEHLGDTGEKSVVFFLFVSLYTLATYHWRYANRNMARCIAGERYQSFRGTCCLHLQGRSVNLMGKQKYSYSEQKKGDGAIARPTADEIFLTSFSSILWPTLLGTIGLTVIHFQALPNLPVTISPPNISHVACSSTPSKNFSETLCLPARTHSVTSQKSSDFHIDYCKNLISHVLIRRLRRIWKWWRSILRYYPTISLEGNYKKNS
jgi:hypothetical protein